MPRVSKLHRRRQIAAEIAPAEIGPRPASAPRNKRSILWATPSNGSCSRIPRRRGVDPAWSRSASRRLASSRRRIGNRVGARTGMIPGSKIQPKGAPPGVLGESRIGTRRVEADATILLQYDLTSIRSYFNTILLQHDVTSTRRYFNTTLLQHDVTSTALTSIRRERMPDWRRHRRRTFRFLQLKDRPHS